LAFDRKTSHPGGINLFEELTEENELRSFVEGQHICIVVRVFRELSSLKRGLNLTQPRQILQVNTPQMFDEPDSA
jgi:hypothetical protein